MNRVLLLVEGQTEEAFVNRVLAPWLMTFGVYVERASLLRSNEPPAGQPFKGGVTSYRRISRDVRRLLADSAAQVTTILDYYGLPSDFPDIAVTSGDDFRSRVIALEAAFGRDIDHRRFRPFLALHEFEAWVFAVPDVAEAHLSARGFSARLSAISAEAGGPEHINDRPASTPSRRLAAEAHRLRVGYGKVADGPAIIEKAGLSAVRAACPHFREWLSWLETLGNETSAPI